MLGKSTFMFEEIVMIIILIMWVILVCYGISCNKTNDPFEQKQTLALRGISAIEIMIGHVGLATGSVVLYPNRKAGILFVGIFFLLSGYGVAYSTEHKPDYLKHFLLNRAVKILLPAYFVKIVMTIIDYTLRNTGEPLTLRLGNFFISLNWYVWEQLFFYFVFWIAYKVAPKYTEIIVGIVSVVFVGVAYIQGMDNPWYGSSLCFVLGLCFYKFEKRNVKCTGARYFILVGGFALVLSVSMAAFFLLGNDSLLGNPIARNIASVSFSVITVMLLHNFRVANYVSVLLGKCSYEIFLIHPYILSILRKLPVESMVLLGILTVLLTLILAYFMHLLTEKLTRIRKREGTKC